MNAENLTEVQLKEIKYFKRRLVLSLDLTNGEPQFAHKNLSLILSLIANSDMRWYNRLIRSGFNSEVNELGEQLFTKHCDDLIVPENVTYDCEYKNKRLIIMLGASRYIDNPTNFRIYLIGNKGKGFSVRTHTPNVEELLNYLEEIDSEEKYKTTQINIKNSFVKYCKQHKLDTIANFDIALILTKNVFVLHDLETVRECYKELYNKTKEESYKYIKENNKLLTEFYGFSNYENFNKFLNNLKSQIRTYKTIKNLK